MNLRKAMASERSQTQGYTLYDRDLLGKAELQEGEHARLGVGNRVTREVWEVVGAVPYLVAVVM